MKKIIFSILTFICLSLGAFAQQGKQIEAVRAAYITNKLSLSPAEAERFWPVYNKYQKEVQQVIAQRRQARQNQKSGGPAVDELKYEGQILDIRKRYSKQFGEIIPSQKVTLLYQAEHDFREQLIKELRDRRQ